MVLIQYVLGHRSMRETIERVFCRFKTQAWLALGNPVGKEKLSMQAMLVFAEMNGHGKALTAVLFIEKTK